MNVASLMGVMNGGMNTTQLGAGLHSNDKEIEEAVDEVADRILSMPPTTTVSVAARPEASAGQGSSDMDAASTSAQRSHGETFGDGSRAGILGMFV